MSGIRFKVLTIFLASLVSMGGFGYMTFLSFNSLTELTKNLRTSILLQDEVEDLKIRNHSSEKVESLLSQGVVLAPEHRLNGLQRVIKAYEGRSQTRLNKAASLFIKNEVEYRRFIGPNIEYFKDRTIYFGGLSLASALFFIFASLVYFQSRVFRPLADLDRKMTDFLHDRYTYQFSVPSNNEIGKIHTTFNALAQRVLRQMEDLQSLDVAKSDFLSIASHELRTPLTSIKGSLSLLKSGIVGDINEAAQNLMNIAEGETDRLIRLINDLLDLAKIDSQKLPLEKKWTPLKPIIIKTFEGLSGLAASAQVELVSSDIPPLQIHADADRVQQILTNLLSNAIKYSPQGGKVEVAIEFNDDDHILINCKDHGKGIAPEDQELIFQKFRQATGPNNPLVKGTGLGLAIAKALVEEHSGQIGVHSVPNQGSTFYFSLPEWRNCVENSMQTNEPGMVA